MRRGSCQNLGNQGRLNSPLRSFRLWGLHSTAHNISSVYSGYCTAVGMRWLNMGAYFDVEPDCPSPEHKNFSVDFDNPRDLLLQHLQRFHGSKASG